MAWSRLRMPRWNFIRLHYVYVISLSMIGMIMLSPVKNMSAIDSFFMAVSAGTVTGLNTYDVKDLTTYQQIIVFVMPLLGQLQFINIVVVLVRLYWFKNRFKDIVKMSRQQSGNRRMSLEAGNTIPKAENRGTAGSTSIRVLHPPAAESRIAESAPSGLRQRTTEQERSSPPPPPSSSSPPDAPSGQATVEESQDPSEEKQAPGHITFSPDTYEKPHRDRALRIPGPREFERGQGVEEVDLDSDDGLIKSISHEDRTGAGPSGSDDRRMLPSLNRLLSHAVSVEHAAASAFILGDAPRARSRSRSRDPLSRTSSIASRQAQPMPYLSYQPTLGRNSQFQNLTPEQRDELGGIEYRSLRLLAKIVVGYYVLYHVVGAVGLLIWIHRSNIHYREVLDSIGIGHTWWAFYSAMTTFNNFGFTLNPDSMIQFRESTWPMLSMIFLMSIGNTVYPCMLRFLIWGMFKFAPKNSAIREPLNFLLDHPRRCYTLLFPSGPTWMLLLILAFLNGVDIILFMSMDLKNPEVTAIDSGWHKFCAGLFQAVSSRTTGTSTFNLSNIHVAVQFSLMVMMYISVFPVAMSIRRTNTYEESSLGVYTNNEDDEDEEVDEKNRASYLRLHIRKQLKFDLWYVFLGVFIILISEGDRIADPEEDAFQVFSILFEIVSAYGNVGLSLGHPSVATSLTGKFRTISKLVICAMMIRGRHRGLPYELDRAIVLPRERYLSDEPLREERVPRIRRVHTQ